MDLNVYEEYLGWERTFAEYTVLYQKLMYVLVVWQNLNN